jgi:hypothetical protein
MSHGAHGLTRSTPAPPGGDENMGGVGGHIGAPHIQTCLR